MKMKEIKKYRSELNRVDSILFLALNESCVKIDPKSNQLSPYPLLALQQLRVRTRERLSKNNLEAKVKYAKTLDSGALLYASIYNLTQNPGM